MKIDDTCGTCGGDGRLNNAFGSTARCPTCHGTGRRPENLGFHDVTKTKPSHHKPSGAAAATAATNPLWPTTVEGVLLATEVKDSSLSPEAKAKLTREIIDHESSHGTCTQTFRKKVRRQIRPAS